MVYEQPRNQFSEMHFEKLSRPSMFKCWNTSFETEVFPVPTFPRKQCCGSKKWDVESVDDPKTSQSIGGRRFPNSETLHAKIPYFKKRVSLKKQKAHMEDRFLRGRHFAHDLRYFRVTGAHVAVFDYSDYSTFLLGATVLSILIPVGIKFHYQQVRFPMTRSWKVCIGCEYESLINSKQCWQCTNKKSIKIYRSRVCRS